MLDSFLLTLDFMFYLIMKTIYWIIAFFIQSNVLYLSVDLN